MTNKIAKHFLVAAALMLGLWSCKVYSFQSAQMGADYKTITIQNFAMATAGGTQNLSFNFNEKLKEYYQRNTNLKLVPEEGDLILSGAIVAYEQTPVSATAGDRAALNRLTITIEVQFQNKINPDDNFEKDFSFYQDFTQEQSLSDVEPALVPKILDQLVLNIFNDTAAQW